LVSRTLLKIHSRINAAFLAPLMSTVTYQSESVVTTMRSLPNTGGLGLEFGSEVGTVGD
jgi:hypothetical protein